MAYAKKEKAEGILHRDGDEHDGQKVSFNREWSGHRFSDDEVEALLNGEVIELTGVKSKKTGKTYSVNGDLEKQSFTNDEGKTFKFWGFKPDFGD